ncbi:CHAD domain-containing protein [Thiospirillum jenense]|uniref:CHAD domain-containing protein n=1 Tax=Thiospirillum jenense TaxID=1653858 RepID=A0A839HIL5_9GAMM|nr:CHAD domain-containing protein [Thiospirillum jenense]MBB1126707.1 CHAD domain-containing protein [Thiospirillum jenense]
MATKTKVLLHLTADQSVSDAFAHLLQHDFTALLTAAKDAHRNGDIEGVHQARVAVRRMRSILTLFCNAIPRTESRPWGDNLRMIANTLGPARDLDVFIEESLTAVDKTLPLPGGEELRQLAKKHRDRTYAEQVEPLLSSGHYRTFCAQFPAWLQQRAWEQQSLNEKHRQRLSISILHYARNRLDKQQRRVLYSGSQIARDDATALHQLRIECKKLRYATESFRSLFIGLDEFILHLKALQDILGIINDVSVTRHLLDTLLANCSDQSIIIYAGALLGWRLHTTRDLLAHQFDPAWNSFVTAGHPWWNNANLA